MHALLIILVIRWSDEISLVSCDRAYGRRKRTGEVIDEANKMGLLDSVVRKDKTNIEQFNCSAS